jgi:hypothetical protein
MNRVSATTVATRVVALAAALVSGAALAAGAGAPANDDIAKKVQAAAEGRGPEVSIPFADRGGIRDWRAVGRDALLVEGTGHHWYRVELFGPCFELPFVERVGFNANPTGEFDRFSAVFVRGQRCAVKSVTASAPPLRRTKDAPADAAPAAAPAKGAPASGAATSADAGKPAAP